MTDWLALVTKMSPKESRVTYEGWFSPVLAPEIVAVGVVFPLAPGAYSVTELPSLLATKVVPEGMSSG